MSADEIDKDKEAAYKKLREQIQQKYRKEFIHFEALS